MSLKNKQLNFFERKYPYSKVKIGHFLKKLMSIFVQNFVS